MPASAVAAALVALLAPVQAANPREELASSGFTFGASVQLELVGNVSGGLKRDVYLLGIGSIFVAWDLAAVSNGAGPRLFAMGLATLGGDPSIGMGDAQLISNLEAADGVQLFRAWIEQPFADEMLVLRVGIYDLDSVFFVIEAGTLFTQSSHGIGPEISGAGQAGLSTFPTTGPTAHLMIAGDGVYGAAALSAGRPSHLLSTIDVPKTEHDGVVGVVEICADDSERYKYAVGAWALSADRPDLETGRPRGGDRGLYALLEHRLHDEGQPGIAGFARLGIASEAVNPIAAHVSGGLVCTGAIPARHSDRAGIAIATANGGNGPGDDVWETDLELIYSAPLFSMFESQVFFHWVMNPGFRTDVDNIAAFGMRLNLTL